MSVLVGFVLYAIRVMRRPMDVRLKKRRAGAFVLVAVASAIVGIWVNYRPHNLPASYFWGELCGVLAIYLMTCALVLATRARWLEQWFGGLDRMYFWHKRSVLLAIALLAPHVFVTGRSNGGQANNGLGDALGVLSLLGLLALVIVSLPRAGRILRVPYERWLFMHRLIGLFVVLALVHGLSVDRVIGGSAGLKAIYILLGVIAIAAYGYDELLMRRRSPHADYTIESIDRPSDNVLDLRLAPVNRVVGPHAGQFVFLRIGGDDAWREHPFSVAGTSPDGQVRLTIRSLGRETRRMHARLEPGLPATVTGPYGMFDYTVGGPHQIWIAGGIGVAPFLSWLTSLDPCGVRKHDSAATPNFFDGVIEFAHPTGRRSRPSSAHDETPDKERIAELEVHIRRAEAASRNMLGGRSPTTQPVGCRNSIVMPRRRCRTRG